MTIQNIDFGTAAANDGEPISTAFQKIQDNFEDLYNGIQTSEVSAIASAATCDIGAVTTPVVRITGTTTITSFGTSTYTKKVVIFVGSLTLTHNATSLILPGAANITTQAGDTCTAISDGSGYWRVFAYQTANRTGSGKEVFDTSPTLATPTLTSPTMTTPTLGVATLTTPAAGAAEFDGTCVYMTAVANARQVANTSQILCLSSTAAGANSTSAQSLFGDALTSGAVTVQGSTAYRFNCFVVLTRSAGANAHTINLIFNNGTATFTSFHCVANVTSTAGDPTATSTVNQVYLASAASPLTITASSTATNEVVVIKLEGVARFNAGGTFIPQFAYITNAPGGAPSILQDSFFELWPIGTSSVVSVGNWS